MLLLCVITMSIGCSVFFEKSNVSLKLKLFTLTECKIIIFKENH